MIGTLLTAARLCGALVTLHGAEVSPQRLCRDAWAGYRAGVRKLDQAAGDCDRLGVSGLDCVLRVYASGPGWRSAKAGEASREFRALAAPLRAAMGWHAPAGKAES